MYQRNIEQLRSHAVNWWPRGIVDEQSTTSIIPQLLASQDDFISILSLYKDHNPKTLFTLIESSSMPANLFLKHLCVILDYGGEPIQRLGREFNSIFDIDTSSNRHLMHITLDTKDITYQFEILPVKSLNNVKLKLDGDNLQTPYTLNSLYKDMIMILMYGAFSSSYEHANLSACDMAERVGMKDVLDEYIKQRYIYVSKITGGAKANTNGQLLQKYVREFIADNLGENYSVVSNGKILLHIDGGDIKSPFDIVIKKGNKIIGIEISFQVTTNSTIERKAASAHNRMSDMHSNGYKIAYIIDGAGNFQRRAAVSTICEYSDCTVAFSNEELSLLCNWVREELSD
ncbi:DpnII family type II restriction endonuclease [Kluyvera intermedia]|uniref:DpnII family type II restriction endonuclease n=1 Tax=Kluyvera intermedia TaxID=61648 RepID=UPI000788787F|nr:DpnII family type II restriction endonuclease [Kluyvera intermedia]WQD29217.1 DpnII family type II restriction endonuclease [Kluyvera intermedia]VDZ84999.1 Type-2 restriction enzyme BanI [Kluyvera intermedia]